MTPEEKQAFANEAEKVFEHPIMQNVMEEYADNMGFELKGLPHYGLRKVAHYAASLARAQALGIDIEELRTTAQEHADRWIPIAERAAEAGVPTMLIVSDDSQSGDGS